MDTALGAHGHPSPRPVLTQAPHPRLRDGSFGDTAPSAVACIIRKRGAGQRLATGHRVGSLAGGGDPVAELSAQGPDKALPAESAWFPGVGTGRGAVPGPAGGHPPGPATARWLGASSHSDFDEAAPGASRNLPSLNPRHAGLLSPRKALGWGRPPTLDVSPETNMPQTSTATTVMTTSPSEPGA